MTPALTQAERRLVRELRSGRSILWNEPADGGRRTWSYARGSLSCPLSPSETQAAEALRGLKLLQPDREETARAAVRYGLGPALTEETA